MIIRAGAQLVVVDQHAADERVRLDEMEVNAPPPLPPCWYEPKKRLPFAHSTALSVALSLLHLRYSSNSFVVHCVEVPEWPRNSPRDIIQVKPRPGSGLDCLMCATFA